MSGDNSLNTGKGRDFQIAAAKILGAYLGTEFRIDYPIAIGKPPKAHRFDLVSSDAAIVGECKNYSWTETGNMPSAKMGFINEAVLYLSHLPKPTKKFIAMRLDRHARRQESLAEFYVRTYLHLLQGIEIFEIDMQTGVVRGHNISKE